MTQHEVVKKTPLLDEAGRLAQPGWARRMNFSYNRERAKKNPFNLKEWNFYQFMTDRWSLQLTIGHVSYMCSVTAALLDLETGEKREAGRMRPFFIPALDRDPEGSSVNEYRDRDFLMRFEVTDRTRLLLFRGQSRKWGEAEVRLDVPNDPEKPKLVIATPFEKPEQFYLNYKENYCGARGFARFGDVRAELDGSGGVLDWGRGIWPYRHQWWWGSLSARVDGGDFGLNLGWGFGDLSRATENVYFYKGKIYKLGPLVAEGDCPTGECRLRDPEGKLELRFVPFYNNRTGNRFLVVDTCCDQVYGRFYGRAETEEGRLELRGLPGFIEHAVNRW